MNIYIQLNIQKLLLLHLIKNKRVALNQLTIVIQIGVQNIDIVKLHILYYLFYFILPYSF